LELVKLEAPSISSTPLTPVPTVSAQQGSETAPIMTTVESRLDRKDDADILTATSQDEATQESTSPSSESH
jgi:hypothetical protein